MPQHSAGASGWENSERDVAAASADPCRPLVEEIDTLQEQIALLEEGLPRAPGMERTALAKEITAFRTTLDYKRRALRKCRGEPD